MVKNQTGVLTYQKSHFLDTQVLHGSATLKISQTLENDQGLLQHTL